MPMETWKKVQQKRTTTKAVEPDNMRLPDGTGLGVRKLARLENGMLWC